MFSQWWWSSGAEANDSGVEIGNSLRFRGAQFLRRAFSQTWSANITISLWFKRGTLSTDQTVVCMDTGGNNVPFRIEDNNTLRSINGSGTELVWDGRYRDASAWYHLVMNNGNAWINGESVETGTLISNHTGQDDCTIGCYGENNSQFFSGYIADFYFIDGQALQPEAFGRENDNGVWVPREVDFTPAQMRNSDYLSVSGGFTSSHPATNGFDGDTDTYIKSNNSNVPMTFAPGTAINFTTSIEVWQNYSGDEAAYGSNAAVSGFGSWKTIFSGSGTIDSSNPIVFTNTTGQSGFNAIRVDGVGGKVLTNPFIWSADLYTAPDTATPNLNSTNKLFAADGAQPAFDGALNTGASSRDPGSSALGNWIIWRPSTSIVARNKLEVGCWYQISDILVNGVSTGISQPNGNNQTLTDLSSALTFPVTIESIACRGKPGTSEAVISAFAVDGQIYIDGANPSFGRNGFHLKFEDPDDLGKDSSGNGNDFTPSAGFNTNPVGIFSNNLFTGANGSTGFDWNTTATNFAAGSPATFGFNDANTSVGTNADNSLVFRPANELTGITEIAVEVDTTDTWQLGLNGADVASLDAMGTAGYKRAQLPANFNGTVTSFGLRNTESAESSAFSRIRINGTTVLVDNTGADYDLMQDSPTQNYATWNPLIPGTQLTDANLTNVPFSSATTNSQTIDLNAAGSTYWEWNTSESAWGTLTYISLGDQPPSGLAWAPNRLQWNSGQSPFNFNNPGTTTGSFSAVTFAGSQPIEVGHTYGFAYANGTLQVLDEGTVTCTLSNIPTDIQLYFGSAMDAGQAQSINFGQRPFVYTPPTGFKKLQTQNLPAAKIANGRDQFAAVTYSGTGSAQSITGLNFKPDLVWIKARDISFSNHLFDSVRGATNRLYSDLPDAASDHAQTLTSFDTTGFSLGSKNTVNNAGNIFVAWCWKAGGTATNIAVNSITASTPSIASSVSANTNAGFSIVSYTGNASDDATIGHGLNSAPELVIYKNRDQSEDWYVYHKDLTQSGDFLQFLKLNSSAKQTTAGGGIDEHPTASLLKVNNNSMINGSDDMIAYCWHSVPGYSAFGSYVGKDTAFPFIFTNFRPALVLIKCSSVGNSLTHWILNDTTRAPHNPSSITLEADTTGAESAVTANVLDFLSNGFKLRSGGDGYNQTGATYVWAAWAENPFGSSNTSPANAR
jgi:hypothetical protein